MGRKGEGNLISSVGQLATIYLTRPNDVGWLYVLLAALAGRLEATIGIPFFRGREVLNFSS